MRPPQTAVLTDRTLPEKGLAQSANSEKLLTALSPVLPLQPVLARIDKRGFSSVSGIVSEPIGCSDLWNIYPMLFVLPCLKKWLSFA